MKPRPRTAVRRRLLALLITTGVLAVVGGLALAIAPDGHLLRLAPALLADSPFTTYRVPGLVLALIVGGAQLWAALAVIRNHPRALLGCTIAAAILAGWIAIQAVMLGSLSWLQPVFFVIALVELMVVAANVPRKPSRARR